MDSSTSYFCYWNFLIVLKDSLWFQQDCAHGRYVSGCLMKTIPGASHFTFRWCPIETSDGGRMMAYPVSGSHCLWFLVLWSYLKKKVLVTKPHTLTNLQYCMKNEISAETVSMVCRVTAGFQKRLETFVWMLLGNIYLMLSSIKEKGIVYKLLLLY